jgi:hypothetical protein
VKLDTIAGWLGAVAGTVLDGVDDLDGVGGSSWFPDRD